MNSKKYGYIAIIVGMAVFNIVSLIIPTEHSVSFWITYSFTNIAFILQILFWRRAFEKSNEIKSKFLGMPIAYISVLYLFFQIICFTIVVASNAQTWVSIVFSVAILGIFCLFVISGEISRNIVRKVEQKVNDDTAFIRNLRQKIDCLIVDEKDPAIQAKLLEVADVAKYSELRSSQESLAEENDVLKHLEAFLSDFHTVQTLDLIVNLLNKRNIIIKSGR